MSDNVREQSSLERFFDSFFQDRNIKWMLGIGVLILFGSSLMLVAREWGQASPLWKYLVVAANCVVIHVGGRFCYQRLGLRRTGTVLLALTLLLLPITFLLLNGLVIAAGTQAATLGFWLLLGMNAWGSLSLSKYTFQHFLRDHRSTVVGSYLILCIAGSVAPLVPTGLSWAAAVALWAVFVAGVVKVNRHVFWLTEENRYPRIFGFFPVALLGTQFLTVFALNFASTISTDWFGFGCVLIAIPILLTADAVAHVFQQRTGDLVRPLPWSITIPLFAGLLLCAVGIGLAATALPHAYALVPSAVLSAGMMFVVARRTGHQAFTWLMLACVAIAYQFSPVFFLEAAKQFVHSTAVVLREGERLPFSFYGLTYLPLILGTMFTSHVARKRGDDVFAPVLKSFSTVLPVILFCASVGNVKAAFLVASAMVGVFAGQAVLYRDRRLAIPAVVAFAVSSFCAVPFVTGVLSVSLPGDARQTSVAFAALALLTASRFLDRRVAGLPLPERGLLANLMRQAFDGTRLLESASRLMAAIVAAWWLLVSIPAAGHHVGLMSGLTIAGVLSMIAIARPREGNGEAAIAFAGTVAFLTALANGISLVDTIYGMTIAGVGVWTAGVLSGASERRLAVAFAHPAVRVSRLVLTAVLLAVYLPLLTLACVGLADDVFWPAPILLAIWAFLQAHRSGSALLMILGTLLAHCLSGAAAQTLINPEAEFQIQPPVWAATSFAFLGLFEFWKRLTANASDEPHDGDPVQSFAVVQTKTLVVGILMLIAVGSMLVFTTPMRIAAGIALAGLMLHAAVDRRGLLRDGVIVVANWQVMSFVVQLCHPQMRTMWQLLDSGLLVVAIPIMLTSAVSLWLFGRARSATFETHRTTLRLLIAFLLAAMMTLLPDGPPFVDGLLIAISFALVAATEARTGIAKQNVERIWTSLVVMGAGVVYLALFRWVVVIGTAALFGTLAAGISCLVLSRLASLRPETLIAAEPLSRTAMVLPSVTVGIGVLRHLTIANPAWLGMNSLALLLAAGFYFWRGLERRVPSLLVMSAIILNVATALLWRELRWSDPQFFLIPIGASILLLVELLRKEIPQQAHDPLRYAGALTILVSPTFHIVGGSWLHLISLMVCSVIVTLVAIGMRTRALMYAGTAFLLADLVAMVVRGSMDYPNLPWIVGLGLGAAVVVLAAFCENHRERLQARLRMLAVELESWE